MHSIEEDQEAASKLLVTDLTFAAVPSDSFKKEMQAQFESLEFSATLRHETRLQP